VVDIAPGRPLEGGFALPQRTLAIARYGNDSTVRAGGNALIRTRRSHRLQGRQAHWRPGGLSHCDEASAADDAGVNPDTVHAPRVLIVEDEPKTRVSIAAALQLEGWIVAEAARGREMIALLDGQAFDLVILDWMLPGRDGVELLQLVRARGAQIPVLMLTARDGLDDRVMGLESGADDYLVKPFAVAELIARCRALLRRPTMNMGEFLRCADLRLDTRARTAWRAEQEILLTPREVDLLEYLLRYQNQIVTREMLERDVWKQAHRFTSLDNVIDVQLMRLRRKIDGEHEEKLIQTLRGVGYRLGQNTD